MYDVEVNHLLALAVMLEEHSISKAAHRLGTSQPAMSRTLARLRDHFDDPLLVRVGKTMRPTRFLQSLAAGLKNLTEQTRGLCMARPGFEPHSATHRFRIGSADYSDLTILPTCVAKILREAPGISIEAIPRPVQLLDALASGDLDLCLTPRKTPGNSLVWSPVLEDSFVCLARDDHPYVSNRLTQEAFLKLPHLLVAPENKPGSTVDDQLARIGLFRHVALRIPTFASAGYLLESTDLIATLPRRVAEQLMSHHDLKIFEHPLDLPGFTLYLVWHAERRGDPAHQWLRQLIRPKQ